MPPGREQLIDWAHAARPLSDVQNYCAHPEGGWWRQHEGRCYRVRRAVTSNTVDGRVALPPWK
jgi:hypothetical protein